MGRLKLWSAFAAVYLIWGSTYLAIRIVLETLPPFLGPALRYLVAGVLLYAWVRPRVPEPARAVHWRSAFAVGGLMLLGGNGMVFWAEQTVPSGVAALIVTTVPLWLAGLAAVWEHDRLGPVGWSGLLLGFAGVALLVAPGSGGAPIDPWGAGALVVASLSWATGSLYSRRAPHPASPLLTTAMTMLGGGVLLFGVSLAAGEPARVDLAAVSFRSWLALAYLVVFGSIVAFSAYVWLMRVARPAHVGTYAYVNPVVAVLLGWLLAGESLDLRIGAAAAVIVTAVALVVSARPRTAPGRVASVRAGDGIEPPSPRCLGPAASATD